MKIAVCVKIVEGELNPFDECALEEALKIPNSEVYVVSMCPLSTKDKLHSLTRLGVKKVFLLSDIAFAGSDTLATAYILSCWIKKQNYDMVFCGRQTIDGDTAQVGAEVAEYLGLPNVSNVLSINDVKEGKVYLTASLDEKVIDMSVKMPCLISAEGDINSPRLPSYKVKQTVTDDMVKFISFNDFEDQNADHYGLSGSATQVERIFPPEKNTEKTTIGGNAQEMTEGLFELVRSRKLI